MAAIELERLRKVYPNGVAAVHGIDLAIADGELIVIVGPSGCGKSTLLRMVAGLETITSGELRIGGRRVNDVEPAERDIAMVFQNYALYPHMSVYDNMAYGLRNRRMKRPEIERRVKIAASILDLAALLERRPRQLSGGQRQRVAMGRAIVREPKAFLFDEPLSNLDAKLRVQMRIEIKRLQMRLGTTSLYVTHDQIEAMTLADRLVVMNAGAAEQVGTPAQIYRAPATVFVGQFIGSPAMNIWDGTIDGDAVRLGTALRVAIGAQARDRNGGKVRLGIRPEHLAAAADGPLEARVDLIENLGADLLLHGRLAADEHAVTIRTAAARSFRPGETIRLAVAPDAIHLFDSETGRRI